MKERTADYLETSTWLVYSKDGTLQGDYVLLNKALMDCASNDYLLTWDGCGTISIRTGTFEEDSLWRIRPRPGQKFKYENISDIDTSCLAVSNYLDIGGNVSANYFSSGDFKGIYQD
jgi:hypothetical protein